MSYKEWFEYRQERDLDVRAYVRAPWALASTDDVARQDAAAVRAIQEAQELIIALTEYRTALGQRYAELEVMPYTRLLRMERHPATSWHPVRYELTITRTYQDGTQWTEYHAAFPGKERRTAFAEFERLKKESPGIPWELDVEKRPWEP